MPKSLPVAPALPLGVQVLVGRIGSPEKVIDVPVSGERAVQVGIPLQRGLITISDRGVSSAIADPPYDTLAGSHQFATWDQWRQYIKTGELTSMAFGVIADGALVRVVHTKGEAFDHVTDGRAAGLEMSVVEVPAALAVKFLG